MAKKRGSRKKAMAKAKASPKKTNASPKTNTPPENPVNESVSAPQLNVEKALEDLEKNVALAKSKPAEAHEGEPGHSSSKSPLYSMPASSTKPVWFYISSIFAAFLFTIYLSIFATLHFESIEYMNITIVFIFISIVSYFLITAIFFISEKQKWHSLASTLFFAGIVAIMVYAFKAIDTSNLVRFSIIYTIIVAAISSYVLAIRK